MRKIKNICTILLILTSTSNLTFGNSICENACFDTCNLAMDRCTNEYRDKCQEVLDDVVEDLELAWGGWLYGWYTDSPGSALLNLVPVVNDISSSPSQIRQAEEEYNNCLTRADRDLQGCMAGCEND